MRDKGKLCGEAAESLKGGAILGLQAWGKSHTLDCHWELRRKGTVEMGEGTLSLGPE